MTFDQFALPCSRRIYRLHHFSLQVFHFIEIVLPVGLALPLEWARNESDLTPEDTSKSLDDMVPPHQHHKVVSSCYQ